MAGFGGVFVGLLVGLLIGAIVSSGDTPGETAHDEYDPYGEFDEFDAYGENFVGYRPDDAAATASVGQCLDWAGDHSPDGVGVPCELPHDIEVFARRPTVEGDDMTYPENLDGLGYELCMAEFEPYVGASFLESSLDLDAYVPDADAWAAGNRDVVCAIYDMDEEPLVGTVEGSGR